VIDVVHRRVAVPAIGLDEPFVLDDYTQHRLLEGLDDIGLTEKHRDSIAAFESNRPSYLPSTRSAGAA
jgi:3-isopropylmalate/(R)-2-methylmalate dehydratase small subunit